MGCEKTTSLLTLTDNSYIIIGVFVIPKNRIMKYVDIAQTLVVWAFLNSDAYRTRAKKPNQVDKIQLKTEVIFHKIVCAIFPKFKNDTLEQSKVFFYCFLKGEEADMRRAPPIYR